VDHHAVCEHNLRGFIYRNFQFVFGIHVVGNELTWSTFLCATL